MHFVFHNRGCGPRGPRGGFGSHPGFTMGWGMGAREGRGPGRRGRMFDGGELRLVLLKLIADSPRHGYDLIREIEELTGGAYAPSPGVVYPTLTLLDEMGLIEEERSQDLSGGVKKRFAATEAGRQHLAERQEEVDALIARLTDLGASAKRSDRGPVRRAMGNLGQAVANRVGRGDWSDDTLHDIAALIDEVAQKIERLR